MFCPLQLNWSRFLNFFLIFERTLVKLQRKSKRAHSQGNEAMVRVLGYYGEGLNAIIVFAACHLPDSSCEDYAYIMENLFL